MIGNYYCFNIQQVNKCNLIYYITLLLQGVLLALLLAAMWGAKAEPPGQITTGAVIHFGEDSASQYDKVV